MHESTVPSPNAASLPPPVRAVLDAIVDRKGRAPVVLSVGPLLGYTDWLVLVSGRSQRHAAGITEGVLEALRAIHVHPIGVDGLQDRRWNLLDYGDFMVHVFHHPVRLYYDLEGMLHEAPRVPLALPAEIMATDDLETRLADPIADTTADPFAADPARLP